MSMNTFDLTGIIHGREYSEHGEFVTADDYRDLQRYSEAVDRLKLGLESDLEVVGEEVKFLRESLNRLYDSLEREYWSEYAGLDEARVILELAVSSSSGNI